MSDITADPARAADTEEPAWSEILAEMKRLREEIDRDQAEIDRLKLETRALKAETRAMLDDLKILVPSC